MSCDILEKTMVLASANQGKHREIAAILEPFGYKLLLQSDFFAEEAEENGSSFVENALIKAKFASSKTNLPALADDSGICVRVLGGSPGIFSSRFAGTGSDADNNNKLLELMAPYKTLEERAAYYYCAIACVKNAEDPTPLIATASWHGYIGFAPKGSGGFGYDPLFVVKGRNLTAAQLPLQIKNLISHRARALLDFQTKFAGHVL